MPRKSAAAKAQEVEVTLSPLDALLAIEPAVLDLVQGSPEWLAVRVLSRPASETAAIMGVSPYDKPFDVWERKTGVTKKKFEHPGLKRGKDFESAVLEDFREKTGIDLEPVVYQRGNYIASLDGIDLFGRCIGEVKITTKNTDLYAHAKNGALPEYYDWQCQQQLMVTDAEIVKFIVRVEEKDTQGKSHFIEDIVIDVLPDRAKWERIVAEWDAFWIKVDTLTAPEETRTYDHKEDSALVLIEEEMTRLMVLQAATEEKIKELRGRLDAACEERGRHVFVLGTITTGFRKGNVDYKKVPQLEGVNLEPYRKAPSKTRTYRLNGEAQDDGQPD